MENGTELIKLPALLTAWRCWYAGGLALLVGGACLLLGVMVRIDGAALASPPVVALAATLGAAAGWLYARAAFAHFGATLLEGEGVIVRKGVLWRTEVMVPISRLQHIDVNQGPLDRRWSMATLTLHTAGRHERGTRIEGLPVDVAHALRASLLPRQPLVHD
jgi:membrane protein YdbS with pleckstrin-like domain